MDGGKIEALKACINDIQLNTKVNDLNEADTRQKIVLRILHLLNWHQYSDDIKLEFGVDDGKVDLALQVEGKNQLFIEVKKPTESVENEKHQKQLLNYSFQEGVKAAVLTNGITWAFYLPLKPVEWKKRWFETITIDSDTQGIDNVVNRFVDLLDKDRVRSGDAEKTAELIWERRQKNQAIMESFPRAWNMILQDPDSLLVDLLEETVAKICGVKPDSEETRGFIRQHHSTWTSQGGFTETPTSGSKKQKPPKVTKVHPKPVIGPKLNTDDPYLILAGNRYQYKKAKEILVIVANWLVDKDHIRPQECPFSVAKSKTRYLVNHTPTHPKGNAFYSPYELKNGLFIETHASKISLVNQAKGLMARYGYTEGNLKVL